LEFWIRSGVPPLKGEKNFWDIYVLSCKVSQQLVAPSHTKKLNSNLISDKIHTILAFVRY